MGLPKEWVECGETRGIGLKMEQVERGCGVERREDEKEKG